LAIGTAALVALAVIIRGRWVALAAGVVVMTLRIALGAEPAAPQVLPEGGGPWPAVVETLGSVRDGQQVATIRLGEADDAVSDVAGVRLAATLPRYSVVGPGDRIEVGGSARPPPDGPFGEYLSRIGVAGTLRCRAARRW
jgi:hypothetical protein